MIKYILDAMFHISEVLEELTAFMLALSWFLARALIGLLLILTAPVWIIPYRIWITKRVTKTVTKTDE